MRHRSANILKSLRTEAASLSLKVRQAFAAWLLRGVKIPSLHTGKNSVALMDWIRMTAINPEQAGDIGMAASGRILVYVGGSIRTIPLATDLGGNVVGSIGPVTLGTGETVTINHTVGTEFSTAPDYAASQPISTGSGANVLLHFDGANGSTTIEDTGTAGLTWTAVSGAAKSTAQHKFGSASLSVSGGAYVTTGGNAAWLWTGDFTVETWVYPTTISGDYRALLCDSSTAHFNLLVTNAGGLALYSNGSLVLSSADGVLTTGSWQHVALCRNAGTLKFYVNGVSVASASVGGNIGSSSLSWYIGYRANDGYHPFVGYFDEFAMWSTEARYSGDFTPQGSAYADATSGGQEALFGGVDFDATYADDGTSSTITALRNLTDATFYVRT